jgi:hypothetical protein
MESEYIMFVSALILANAHMLQQTNNLSYFALALSIC